ncbi:MAG: hypothetical protein KDA61_10680 [Planctomycetales bacterium]|nr:hypothetical protein [Planctomycetales bacterium]
MADGEVTLLDPALLRADWVDHEGNLKPALVTSLYSGGTPTNANQLKPCLTTAEGKLKPSLLDHEGNLKSSLLRPS